MSVQSPEELAQLRRIGRIVAMVARAMAQKARPGITTEELDAFGAGLLRQHGARSAPRLAYNFPGTTCISINDEAAHGIPGRRMIEAGDLINIDVSAELDGFFGDTGLMVQVPPVSPVAQKLCECSREALRQAIQVVRAGTPINAIGRAIEDTARTYGFQVLHDLDGHGVGRHIHEAPQGIHSFYNRHDRRRLTDGLVFTIEPFITTGAQHTVLEKNGWTLHTVDRGLVAQHEHTLVVTRQGAMIMTDPQLN
jgi:methionyl aminopeptidase